ncbi:MAG: glycosyltransferase, partial [Rubrivivax sp.]|nr:glycosyltransferase [Rubrivivax sp.]
MIRVLFVATGLDVGGAEISLLNILQHLDRSRFEAHVVSLTGHGDVAPRIAALGITVTSFDFARQPLRSWTGLRRLMRNLRPHVVQTWMYHADLIG